MSGTRQIRWVSPIAVGLLSCLIWGSLSIEALAASRIQDGGQFFSESAREQVLIELRKLEAKHGKEVVIETYATIPAADLGKLPSIKSDEATRNRYFADMLRHRGLELKVKGVLVLIWKDPGHIRVGADKPTRDSFLPDAAREDYRGVIASHFRDHKYDDGLIASTKRLQELFEKHANVIVVPGAASAASHPASTTNHSSGARQTGSAGHSSSQTAVPAASASAPAAGHESQGGSFSSLLMLGVVVVVALVGLWIVIGVIRTLTGWGRPSPNYGGGYGGGGYGGGYGSPHPGGYGVPQGSGFMGNMLTGMLGAAAGMWVYDHFLRSGSPHQSNSSGLGNAAYGDDSSSNSSWDGSRSSNTSDDYGASSGGSDFDSGAGGSSYESSSNDDSSDDDYGSSSSSDDSYGSDSGFDSSVDDSSSYDSESSYDAGGGSDF